MKPRWFFASVTRPKRGQVVTNSEGERGRLLARSSRWQVVWYDNRKWSCWRVRGISTGVRLGRFDVVLFEF